MAEASRLRLSATDLLTYSCQDPNTVAVSRAAYPALSGQVAGNASAQWKSAARGRREGLRWPKPQGYTPDLYNQKCSAVFEHVYESYPERDAATYA